MTQEPFCGPGNDSEQRAFLIAGLRELADFLDATPEMPVERFARVYLYYGAQGTKSQQRNEVDRLAAIVGAEAEDRPNAGHRVAYRYFGPAVFLEIAAVDEYALPES